MHTHTHTYALHNTARVRFDVPAFSSPRWDWVVVILQQYVDFFLCRNYVSYLIPMAIFNMAIQVFVVMSSYQSIAQKFKKTGNPRVGYLFFKYTKSSNSNNRLYKGLPTHRNTDLVLLQLLENQTESHACWSLEMSVGSC